MDLQQLQALVTTTEEGSISQAARQLQIPRATLSRRLGDLEDDLGVPLLHRTTRRLSLTEAGRELYPRALRLLADAHEAQQAVAHLDGTPRGTLRVSVPPGEKQMMLDMLLTYRRRWPQVALEVTATARHVDLIDEGFDVALRAGPVVDERLVTRTLLKTQLVAVASPDFIADHGMPASPTALTTLPCIRGFALGRTPQRVWPLRDGGEVAVDGELAFDDLEMAFMAARQGVGIALVPAPLALPHFEDHTLVPVLPHDVGAEVKMSVCYPHRDHVEPKVRAFVDLVVEHKHLWNDLEFDVQPTCKNAT